MEKAGATVDLVSPHKLLKGGKIKAWNLVHWGDSFRIDVALSNAKVSSYDGLHVPGGVINPDILRMDTDAIDFIRSFFEAANLCPRFVTGHGCLSKPTSSEEER